MASRDKHDRMANAIRFLSMDAVEKANSGHPGLPMGCADIATVLFTTLSEVRPEEPGWPDRDRFVLSAGHGSMLLYSLLYLLGYEDMTIDEIKQLPPARLEDRRPSRIPFRRRHRDDHRPARPGPRQLRRHGDRRAHMNAQFGDDLVDHHTWVIAGDGCLMEGISQEAISLAGHLKLNKLIVIWDNNNITIDGAVSLADSTDQIARFKASGWNTIAHRRPRPGGDRRRRSRRHRSPTARR